MDKRMMRARGQVLVIFAVFILVAALLLQLSYFLYSAFRQKRAAEEAAHAAARAGCMRVRSWEEGEFALPYLDEWEVQTVVRKALLQGLPLLPYGLADGVTPQEIVEQAEIYAVNAYPWFPQPSPFRPHDPPDKWYTSPFVAVGFTVPTKAFFMSVPIRVEVEDAVLSVETQP